MKWHYLVNIRSKLLDFFMWKNKMWKILKMGKIYTYNPKKNYLRFVRMKFEMFWYGLRFLDITLQIEFGLFVL